MAVYPCCGKNFEAHAVAGRQEGLRICDVVICSGCGVPLILQALPYEMRLMTDEEFRALDPETRPLGEAGLLCLHYELNVIQTEELF